MVMGLRGGGDFAKVPQRRRISSVSPELAHLHLFQAAEAPRLREGQNSSDRSSQPPARFTESPALSLAEPQPCIPWNSWGQGLLPEPPPRAGHNPAGCEDTKRRSPLLRYKSEGSPRA